MALTFNRIVNLTIISLGGYLCAYAIHERRAAVMGLCLITFGSAFALADHFGKHHRLFAVSTPETN
jgi:hypothetical protein